MICYVNQRFNQHPRLHKLFKDLGHDFQNLSQGLFRFNPGLSGVYNRHGRDTLPFKNGLKHLPGFAMPAYDATFNQSWSEITNQRCHELRQRRFDKKWVIAWSGGIDSTTIITSIIKNLPAADFHNIIIACNKFSVWENPKFFQDFIHPNFQTMDSMNLLDIGILEEHIVIDGEPADQLFAGGISLAMMLSHGLEFLEKDIVKDADLIIKYIAYTPMKSGGEVPGEDFAQWYYTAIMDNIRSVDIPLNTFHDLMWWIYFNFSWSSAKLRELESYRDISNAVLYLENFVHWFDADSYQLWAMTNNIRGQKYGSNVGHYKLAAKQYIFDLDKNAYFLKYKTKLFSGNYKWYRPGKFWYCMTDDFRLLNLNDHWPIIRDLLPDHLCGA
jgi:hypothetical protein